jgi:hypothetical protein
MHGKIGASGGCERHRGQRSRGGEPGDEALGGGTVPKMNRDRDG